MVRSEGRSIGVETHVAGTAAPGREVLLDKDWTRRRSIGGRQTVVKRPLAFPLSPGRSWTFSFDDDTPPDRRHANEHVAMSHRVAGWEEITVPAGTFRALRIDGNLDWTVELAPNTGIVDPHASAALILEGIEVPLTLKTSGRHYSGRVITTGWYVPEVHRWVRSEESVFDSDNQIVKKTTSVLGAFSLAGGAAGGRGVAAKADVAPGPSRRPVQRSDTARSADDDSTGPPRRR